MHTSSLLSDEISPLIKLSRPAVPSSATAESVTGPRRRDTRVLQLCAGWRGPWRQMCGGPVQQLTPSLYCGAAAGGGSVVAGPRARPQHCQWSPTPTSAPRPWSYPASSPAKVGLPPNIKAQKTSVLICLCGAAVCQNVKVIILLVLILRPPAVKFVRTKQHNYRHGLCPDCLYFLLGS